MQKRNVAYNSADLGEKYPHLHEVVTEILESDKMKFLQQRIAFNMGYKRNGKERKMSLGSLIELAEDNGYLVEIRVQKKPD
jgi:hypothetical protein